MAIVVSCDRCKKELMEKGAILWSPPYTIEDREVCEKYHLCVKCYVWLIKITMYKPKKKK